MHTNIKVLVHIYAEQTLRQASTHLCLELHYTYQHVRTCSDTHSLILKKIKQYINNNNNITVTHIDPTR